MVVAPAGNIGGGDVGGNGVFTINNNLTILGGATMRISVNNASPAEDQISVTGNIIYGGVLTVTNITTDATPLTTSYTFPLFLVTGSHSGNFSAISGSPGGGIVLQASIRPAAS